MTTATTPKRRGRPRKDPSLTNTTCSGPECSRVVVAFGLCHGHYAYGRRHPGKPLLPLRLPTAQVAEKMVGIGAAVRPATARALHALAAKRGVSISELLRTVLEAWPALKTPEAKP